MGKLKLLNLVGSIFTYFVTSSFSIAQDGGQISGLSKGVAHGTFAISHFPNNEVREATYTKSSAENWRVVTYLPKLTMIYNISERYKIQDDYFVSGINQFGIPVQVLETELTIKKIEQDVVSHRIHKGCRDKRCELETFSVLPGDVFEIIEEDEYTITLRHPITGAISYYSRRNFESAELTGHLTLHKGRINPRWSIQDGYASKVSLGCGATKTANFDISAKLSDYKQPPTSWEMNDERWSIKAIELFDLGTVKVDEDKDLVKASVRAEFGHNRRENSAVDITVYAYQDTSWRSDDRFKFAAIAQTVHCEPRGLSGSLKPHVVEKVQLVHPPFGNDVGVGLEEKELPQQLTFTAKKRIFKKIGNRTFFYSINNAEDYGKVFEMLSEVIESPIAIANLIARLNASCGQDARETCSEIVKADILSKSPPNKKPDSSPE